jgi:hypothetical protein
MDFGDFVGQYGNAKNFGTAAGLGGIGAGLFSMMNQGNNPADEAMPYLNQIPGQISPYYQPYVQAGQGALGAVQPEYQSLMSNPGGKLNQIGQNFQQSPGFKFALQQALQGAGHAAAAGGMAGSPEHEFQNMQIGTNLGNQEYYNWLNPATQLYGTGLTGTQDIFHQGQQASGSMADQIAQMLAAQAGLTYKGQAAQNQAQSSALGNVFGGAATLAAFLP